MKTSEKSKGTGRSVMSEEKVLNLGVETWGLGERPGWGCQLDWVSRPWDGLWMERLDDLRRFLSDN